MAPEILQSHKYDAKADLWSVGTILYELVVGRPPFNGSNHVALLHNIQRHDAKIPDQIAQHLSPACIDLIYSLLKRNPVQRISFEEFFNHPFLAATAPLAATVHGEASAVDLQSMESGTALLAHLRWAHNPVVRHKFASGVVDCSTVSDTPDRHAQTFLRL